MTSGNGRSAAPKSQRPFTDLGNGERFVLMHQDTMRYVPAWSHWVYWDGHAWRRDETLEAERRAKATVRAISDEADSIEDEAWRKKTLRHARESESVSRISAMLRCASAERGIAVPLETFDADPWLLNCLNGVVDLSSGTMLPHAPGQFFLKFVPVHYDPAAQCPVWRKFLQRIFGDDDELVAYIQRAVGYTLTGTTDAQVLHLLHGTGQNGKSTFLETLGALMGEYAANASFDTFLETKQQGPREDVARLVGKRLVKANEVGEGKRLDEALIQRLTGQDIVTARHLYGATFEFRPMFKLWLAVNHKPVIRGTEIAIWRRLRLVPFLVTIPLDDRDEKLGAKLRAELPGILNWAVEGCLAWQREGLKSPDKVQIATSDYRDESDIFGAFLVDCCDVDPQYEEPSEHLFEAYKTWCKRNNEYCVTQNLFGRRITDRKYGKRHTRTGDIRTGLRLKPTAIPSRGGFLP